MIKDSKIRVRMAPSPTGNLHIGTAQTTLYNWLFARHTGGDFFLRIENTDAERSKKEYEENIIENLKWLGLSWDNENIVHQSEMKDVYRKYLEQLLSERKAFWCDHSKEELEAEQKDQTAKKEAPRHVCSYKLQATSYKLDGSGIIRLAVNENSTREIVFEDQIRGRVAFKEHLLGDISIARNLDSVLYHFAVVVDDIEMEISHVIRGEDHISNTPKHLLIYEALDKTPPLFAHIPLILASDRSKLSKRHGATAVSEYKKDYLPEALINFLGFLGYTYSKEIISKEEMAEEFKLSKVHKSGAVFNIEKLNWINSQYIRKLSPEEFKKTVGIREIPESAVPIITERLERLSDVKEFEYLWKEPEYEPKLLIWKDSSKEDVTKSLQEVEGIISSHDFGKIESKDSLRLELDDLGKKLGNRGLAYWPLRVALTGKEKSPDPVEVAGVIGREKSLGRVKAAIDKLS